VRLQLSFDQIDGLAEKTKIIVNRVGLESGQIKLKKARETIGRDIFFQIPNDYRTMVEVRNNGTPLLEQSPKAPVTIAIKGLADLLESDGQQPAPDAAAQAASTTSSGSWLNFWPKSKA
jgi:pilus assembly protein CpaE